MLGYVFFIILAVVLFLWFSGRGRGRSSGFHGRGSYDRGMDFNDSDGD